MEGELTGLPVAMKADERDTCGDESLLINRGCVWGGGGETKADINFEEAHFKAVSILGIHAA